MPLRAESVPVDAFSATSAKNPVAAAKITTDSPNGRNRVELIVSAGRVTYRVLRDERALLGPSPLGPQLKDIALHSSGNQVLAVRRSEVDEQFDLPWGKTKQVVNRGSRTLVTLTTSVKLQWEVELCAYDDGIGFRYRLLPSGGPEVFTVQDEATQFDLAGNPAALFNTLESFTTSHESLYERTPLVALPRNKLFDCPLLLVWPDGMAAAITEARVRDFAGMYLERLPGDSTALRSRLSPLPKKIGDSPTGAAQAGASVVGNAPITSPWRVILLADAAGKLIESNLLLCLNDPPQGDFSWAKPGKTTFHWWYGDFEDDFKLDNEREVYVARHQRYIDFCAGAGIAYHSLSGDGFAWYQQSRTPYGTAVEDADVCVARPELGLPEILAYAQEKGVGIRLWVHWKPLSQQLDEAMATYASWGVKGLMVDFLDRDDQEMLAFADRMLSSAARHKIHIQIHGSSKYSGEQRTFPNLFNREGVLNLEYSKWSKFCTPAHSVNVAYTRALAGPVDFHLGGFRSVPRADFQPRDRAPVVMGTRCHNLALYVVYENPMPMVADSPSAYVGQTGFDFIKQVPTTWDETRFLQGEAGESIVVARRRHNIWYVGGITNWTPRSIKLDCEFLASGEFAAEFYVDGSLAESQPNQVRQVRRQVTRDTTVPLDLASGGGFVAIFVPPDH